MNQQHVWVAEYMEQIKQEVSIYSVSSQYFFACDLSKSALNSPTNMQVLSSKAIFFQPFN